MSKNTVPQILQDRWGSFSSKRLTGMICTGFGLMEKFALFVTGLMGDVTNFSELDASANWLIGFGVGLLGTSVLEQKKK